MRFGNLLKNGASFSLKENSQSEGGTLAVFKHYFRPESRNLQGLIFGFLPGFFQISTLRQIRIACPRTGQILQCDTSHCEVSHCGIIHILAILKPFTSILNPHGPKHPPAPARSADRGAE
jgi:hypothetical protein